jgi:hypothetical protein
VNGLHCEPIGARPRDKLCRNRKRLRKCCYFGPFGSLSVLCVKECIVSLLFLPLVYPLRKPAKALRIKPAGSADQLTQGSRGNGQKDQIKTVCFGDPDIRFIGQSFSETQIRLPNMRHRPRWRKPFSLFYVAHASPALTLWFFFLSHLAVFRPRASQLSAYTSADRLIHHDALTTTLSLSCELRTANCELRTWQSESRISASHPVPHSNKKYPISISPPWQSPPPPSS